MFAKIWKSPNTRTRRHQHETAVTKPEQAREEKRSCGDAGCWLWWWRHRREAVEFRVGASGWSGLSQSAPGSKERSAAANDES